MVGAIAGVVVGLLAYYVAFSALPGRLTVIAIAVVFGAVGAWLDDVVRGNMAKQRAAPSDKP